MPKIYPASNVPEQPGPVIPQGRGKMGARTVHVLSGAAMTPFSMTTGAITTAAVAPVLAFGEAAVGVRNLDTIRRKHSKRIAPADLKPKPQPQKTIDQNKDTLSNLVSEAKQKAKIASLQMIPVVGNSLANQFRATGTLKGFIDTPAFGELLASANISVPRIVYGFRNNPSLPENREISVEESAYFRLKKPSLSDTKSYLKKQLHNQKDTIVVRIPTSTYTQKTRYHDGTLLISPTRRTLNAPTVVIYHGNGEHRDNQRYNAEKYLERGYNVFLASYAGDHVIVGKGNMFEDSSTKSSELSMKEDAQADVAFLKSLGVHNVAVHGYSLGGAQGMAFAQAMANDASLTMDFVVLDRTFSNMPDVVQNVVENLIPNKTLGKFASDYARMNAQSEVPESLRIKVDCLNSAKKLTEVATASNFAHTHYIIRGAENDTLMGRQEKKLPHPRPNFAYELKDALPNSVTAQRIFWIYKLTKITSLE